MFIFLKSKSWLSKTYATSGHRIRYQFKSDWGVRFYLVSKIFRKMLACNAESLVFLQKQKIDAGSTKGNNENPQESPSKLDNKWQRARNRNHG